MLLLTQTTDKSMDEQLQTNIINHPICPAIFTTICAEYVLHNIHHQSTRRQPRNKGVEV